MPHCVFGDCNSDTRINLPGYDPSLKWYPLPQPCLLLRESVLQWSTSEEAKHVRQCKKCRLCSLWMQQCRRSDEKFSSVRFMRHTYRICGKHFSETPEKMDFEKYIPEGANIYKPCGEYKHEVNEWTPNEEKAHILRCKKCRLCRDWMHSCNRSDSKFQSLKNISFRTHICSEHFEENLEALNYEVHRPMSYVPVTSGQRRMSARKQTAADTVVQNKSVSKTADAQTTQSDHSYCHDVSLNFPIKLEPCEIKTEELEEMELELEQIPTASASTNTDAVLMIDVGTQVDLSMKSVSSQTTYKLYDTLQLQQKISQLTSQLYQTKAKISKLENRSFSINDFAEKVLSKPKMCEFYTGFDVKTYYMIKELVKEDKLVDLEGASSSSSGTSGTRRVSRKFKNLTVDAQLMLLFLRVRRGLILQDIAYQFDLDASTVSRIVTSWVLHMYSKFDAQRTTMFASREVINEHLPEKFKDLKNIRIIIDCVEFICEKPSNFKQPDNGSSPNKTQPSFKFLLGCSPNGALMFVSDVFDGSISDREIVNQSGLTERLEDGDLVLVDRGLTIKDVTDKKGARIPAFLKGRDGLISQKEINPKLGVNRFLVDHVVGRLKKFKFLQRVIPLNMKHILPQIVFVCACLLNLNPPSLQLSMCRTSVFESE